MLRATRALRLTLRTRPALPSTRLLSSPASPRPASLHDAVPVDDLCLPLHQPYSISDYLPSPEDTPSLSRETLLKLHRLAALEPPSSEQDWADLNDLDELVAIVQAVRDVDTSALGLRPGEMVDARVRADPEPVDWDKKSEPVEPVDQGQRLLKLAQRTEGAYFVAPMPENVKTRKMATGSTSEEEALSEDEY
ncbi:hypothetical protein JCM10207_002226 [Rhodosporidiobolus poonsookiae]